jgi:hypothetical protein
MRQALLILCVAVAGCVGAAPDPSELEHLSLAGPETPGEEGDITYEREQGRYILGSFADGLAVNGIHYRIPEDQSYAKLGMPAKQYELSVNEAGALGINGTHLVAQEGLLSHTGTDDFFDGKILKSPMGRLRIRGTAEAVGFTGITSTVYFLDYELVTPEGTDWVDYCGAAGGGAIPISGYYDSRRVHRPGPWITFACKDGVARKCNSWGYIAGNKYQDDNWDFHQACTGMANASYCGDGVPKTREKTPIKMRDAVPGYGNDDPYDFDHPDPLPTDPDPLPGDPDTYYIEAAWKRNGRPFCLARVRWQALAPNECGTDLDDLHDPRYSTHDDAQFCDQWSIAQLLTQPDVVLVNGSKMMDAALHTWSNGTDVVTTIRGYFIDRNDNGIPDSSSSDPLLRSIPPFPGYTTHVGIEGMVLRNLPGVLLESHMHRLYMQNLTTGGDRHLSDAGGGREDPSFEGYSFENRPTLTTQGISIDDLEELNLCKPADDHDVVVGPPPAGCTNPQSLHFALPAP